MEVLGGGGVNGRVCARVAGEVRAWWWWGCSLSVQEVEVNIAESQCVGGCLLRRQVHEAGGLAVGRVNRTSRGCLGAGAEK